MGLDVVVVCGGGGRGLGGGEQKGDRYVVFGAVLLCSAVDEVLSSVNLSGFGQKWSSGGGWGWSGNIQIVPRMVDVSPQKQEQQDRSVHMYIV